MAKVIYVLTRNPNDRARILKGIMNIGPSLLPDNIDPKPAIVEDHDGLIVAILNPNPAITQEKMSTCLGMMIRPPDEWWRPGGPIPEGSFALFRGEGDSLELVSDYVASRTIWYIETDSIFAASTSQRALISLLGDFQPNEQAIAWMLSSGTLGPENSWDERIRCIRPNSCLFFDRNLWQMKETSGETLFTQVEIDVSSARQRMHEVLDTTFDGLQFEVLRWVLPLSGGVDSRGLLLFLGEEKRPRCVTWGLQGALSHRRGDAFIASKLAEALTLDHRFLPTDFTTNEPAEKVIQRFLVAGEGRIDHIAGYMDGFQIWKQFFDEGTFGVLRADEGFGWVKVFTPFDARRSMEFTCLDDIAGLPNEVYQRFGPHGLPVSFIRRSDETLAMWRDRLYHDFRIPVVLAALNDLKAAYVEIMNPFLARSIIQFVRTLPDDLRTDKKLFQELVWSLSPPIPFARLRAIGRVEDILTRSDVVQLIMDELNSLMSKSLLPRGLIRELTQRLESPTDRTRRISRVKAKTKQWLPPAWIHAVRRVRNRFDRQEKIRVSDSVFAFRLYLATKMHQILQEDANALNG